MNQLFRNLDAFDILFRNYFQDSSVFEPADDAKIGHPVDIYKNDEGLHFEIAGTGLTKEDIKINIEQDILRVSYDKPQNEGCCEIDNCHYINRGIARRSFNLGYRISSKFSLVDAQAEMENGLLKISIPFSEEALPKELKIK